MDRQRISLTHAHHGMEKDSIDALVHLALRGSLHPANLSALFPTVLRVSGKEDIGVVTVLSRVLDDLAEVLIDRLNQLLDQLTPSMRFSMSSHTPSPPRSILHTCDESPETAVVSGLSSYVCQTFRSSSLRFLIREVATKEIAAKIIR